ncbi:aminoglycoside phosphotransferase family protein [Rhodoplanes sp. TEM]|uniref:Aminoglycoside phosphotransferase family protein n=1 Tax=Rhodoplanes tepidamans TaxID=200616 RepID=A0ABT5J5M3_RHOTP|nr:MULTISPECIES: aminoglycoside phosphotransferase family protein [Rhodoplanes]MDC7784340.1 aminoglycoside phosphotransferase family protein [Rhodoplanes tepidamans]MDC7983396.1 aminoglycoside phosphotransferase family protein [Rhodoplanes sp. TEM]MDQ0354532.1 fructosamine-3-kinase [Rhodoplanes tepidamans]
MLSKLAFFEAGAPAPSAGPGQDEALRAAIARQLGQGGRPVRVVPASGGTLGVCCHVEVGAERLFLKTHLPSAAARANLAKEGEILRRLYGTAVLRDAVEVVVPGEAARLCLVMAELAPRTAPMPPADAAALVRDFSQMLAGWRPAGLPDDWTIEHYVAHGERAVARLEGQGFLTSPTAAAVAGLLAQLRAALEGLPRVLCHGDLGPKNLMTDGSRPVAIDWEDAFWGVPGYDYLYWLTFIENRPHLSGAAFGRTGLGAPLERAILALVVLLKSELSVRSGAHLRHAVPIEARMAEVLALPAAS